MKVIEEKAMRNLREQFEKLQEIAERLKNYKMAFYNGEYIAEGRVDDCKLWIAVGFVGGAWYAFQEHQKKIDAAINECESWYKSSGSALALKIQELLK